MQTPTRYSGPPPILVIGYKRADLLAETLSVVTAHGQAPVYISIDHPKRPTDATAVEQTILAAECFAKSYPHQCHIRRLSTNQGICRAVPSAVSWVLESHESVIILEDDCLPHPSFFPFCNEMLDRYRDDQRVFMVSGNNMLPESFSARWPASYFFVRTSQTWGWATWRRAWKYYDHPLGFMTRPDYRLAHEGLWYGGAMDRHWHRLADAQRQNQHDTSWDSRWLIAMASQSGLSIVPNRNLVRNTGFGPGASHTVRNYGYFIKPRRRLAFPLIHPTLVAPWRDADMWWFDHLISKSLVSRLRRFSWRVDPAAIAAQDET